MLLKTSLVPAADQASQLPHKEFLKEYQKTTIKDGKNTHAPKEILKRCETIDKDCGNDN